MPSLLKFQRDFATSVFAQGATTPPTSRRSALFSVYRNNVFSNFREALRATYPAVEQLVGADFFEHAACRFVPNQPSTSGDLQRYGEGFAEFFETFPGTRSLPYLCDTAELEWLIHESFHAADHAPLPLSQLTQIAPEDGDRLMFVLHPACRLIASNYPIHRIWHANQPGRDGVVDLGNVEMGGVWLLVRRRGFAVELESITRGEFTLLSLLATGQRFARACEHVLRSEPEFDVAAFLRRHVMNATLVDFYVIKGDDDGIGSQ